MLPTSLLNKIDLPAPVLAHYNRLMRLMFFVTIGLVSATLIWLYYQNDPVSVHFYIATALGIGLSMLLMSALIGLVFLSNHSGHDAAVVEFTPLDTTENPRPAPPQSDVPE